MVTKDVDDKGKVRVFVYGTLKQGQVNHALIEKSGGVFLGYDTIKGPFYMFNLGGFPAVCQRVTSGEKSRTIYGQIYVIDDEGLAALDHFEGHPHFFERRKVWSDEKGKRVWVYFLNNEDFINDIPLVNSGLWNPLPAECEAWGIESGKEG